MEALIKQLVAEFQLDPESYHGLAHWQRVEAYGLHLAAHNHGDLRVVRYFAYFHDCCRVSESSDHGHGLRGAEKARRMREHIELDDEAFETLFEACAGHTDLIYSHDPTIACCWDADRLDLDRVGAIPDPQYLITKEAKRLALLPTQTRRAEVKS